MAGARLIQIAIKSTEGAGSSLINGEFALNTNDDKLYLGQGGVKELFSNVSNGYVLGLSDSDGDNVMTAAEGKTAYLHSQTTTGNPHNIAAADISDVYSKTEVDTEIDADIATHAGLTDPHTGYMLESNIGTAANNYVQLDGDAKFGAIDGSALTNITNLVSGVTIPSNAVGTTQSANDNSTKMATTEYVDTAVDTASVISQFKDSVMCATTAALPTSIAADTEAGDTIDGYTLVVGDRILIKNEGDVTNGIYVVQASGGALRADDWDTGAEIPDGSYVFVNNGTDNALTGWMMTLDGGCTVGTHTSTFAQFFGVPDPGYAGNGINISGGAVSVDPYDGADTSIAMLTVTSDGAGVDTDDSSIEHSSGVLQVKALGITNAMLNGSIADGKLAEDYIKVSEIDDTPTDDHDDNPISSHWAHQHLADLASTAENYGADLIGVYDAQTEWTATTVRGVLAEIQDEVDGLGTSSHAELHAMTDTADHSATNWRLFHSDDSGHVVEIGLGTSGQVLQSTGASSAPAFATLDSTDLSDVDTFTVSGGTWS